MRAFGQRPVAFGDPARPPRCHGAAARAGIAGPRYGFTRLVPRRADSGVRRPAGAATRAGAARSLSACALLYEPQRSRLYHPPVPTPTPTVRVATSARPRGARRPPRRPLRLAPRPRGRRGPGLPRGRERLHRRAARPPRAPARDAGRRVPGPGRRDRHERALPQGRVVVLQPHRRGPRLPHPLPPQGQHGCAGAGPARRERARRGPGVPGRRRPRRQPGHPLLAYSFEHAGDEQFHVRVLDLETGDHLPDAIEGTSYGLEWSADGQHLLYTTLDAALRPYRLFRHRLAPTRPTTCCSGRRPTRPSTWRSPGRPTRRSWCCTCTAWCRARSTCCPAATSRPGCGSSSRARRASSTASSTTTAGCSSWPTTGGRTSGSSARRWTRRARAPGRSSWPRPRAPDRDVPGVPAARRAARPGRRGDPPAHPRLADGDVHVVVEDEPVHPWRSVRTSSSTPTSSATRTPRSRRRGARSTTTCSGASGRSSSRIRCAATTRPASSRSGSGRPPRTG